LPAVADRAVDQGDDVDLAGDLADPQHLEVALAPLGDDQAAAAAVLWARHAQVAVGELLGGGLVLGLLRAAPPWLRLRRRRRRRPRRR
jgi:hypothetical protein